jgi:two-component system sensor histidine kinase/response regulator
MFREAGPRSVRVWVLGLALIPLAFLILVLAAFLRLGADAQSAAAWAQHSDDALMRSLGHSNRQAVCERQVAKTLHDPKYGQSPEKIAADLAQFQRAEQRLWNQLRIAIIGTMLGGVLAVLALGLALNRRIVPRLRLLCDQAKAFAASGTLPQPLGGNDEVAELSRALCDMAGSISARSGALERYRLLAEMAHDAIVFMRRSDARIIEVNRAASDLYGYSRDELLQLTGYDLRTPAAAAVADSQIPNDRPFSAHFETEHRRKDGSVFPVEISMQSAYLDGQHTVVSVIRDVSRWLEAEAGLKAALRQATEASRLKSEFVATMSHEIRTPMNGVLGMTELLLESNLDPEQRQFALTARESAQSLLGVINNILDFSKIEAGKIETEIVEFDVVAQVEGVASMLGRQAHKKGISMMSYVDPLIPARLLGDAMRLRQVLVNLADNAVKFTSQGGVALIVDPISLESDGVRVRFTVRDTGIGIPPAALPGIFEAFRQADGSTTRRFGGTGLGLAISKRLVELMGGQLQVESLEGQGSTFFFHVNLRVAASAPAVPRPRLDRLPAVIVDDDVMARDILSRYVNSWGLRTAVAQSADAALAMMLEAAQRREPYSIAIIDLRLPHVDGFELARRIRAEPLLQETKLLLVTAFDAPNQGQEAIRAGFSAYLTKPIRQSELYDAIVAALCETNANAPTEVRADPVSPPHGDRILLVEDNDVNRRVALRQLERLGYSAQCAGDGREALERIAREPYDLIFMDCQMPVMDGFQATREIRKMESRTGKRVPIVAMTANAMAGDREACLSAGMDDYLPKPIALSDVSRILRRWLASARES